MSTVEDCRLPCPTSLCFLSRPGGFSQTNLTDNGSSSYPSLRTQDPSSELVQSVHSWLLDGSSIHTHGILVALALNNALCLVEGELVPSYLKSHACAPV